MSRKSLYVLLVTVFIAGAAFLALNNSTTAAQQNISAKWEYREFVFQTPVSFGSTFADGYYNNGVLAYPSSPDSTVASMFNYLGGEGWELVTNLNNQYFIFKRPIL
jgi:hypothetical protein